MRLRRLLVLLCAVLALAACAQTAQHSAELARSELDVRMYGAPQPTSYTVRRATQVIPVVTTTPEVTLCNHVPIFETIPASQ